MRKVILLLASIGLAVLLASGVALAATIDCRGGSCVGTQSDDTLFGSPRVDKEFGLGGNDLMYGYKSADRMSGNRGGDRMYGGPGADMVNGGPGNDSVVGDKGNDTLRGGPGNDLIQAVDNRKDQINCAGDRDRVYYDRGLDVLRECEVRNAR